MKKAVSLLISFLLLLGSPAQGSRSIPFMPDWQAKIDPWVQVEAAQGETEFLVMLTEQADLSGVSLLSDKQAKGAFVYQQLTKTAARTQKPLLVYLESMRIEHRPFWIANMLWVRAGQDVVQQRAAGCHTDLSLRRAEICQQATASPSAAGGRHRMEPVKVRARSLECWLQQAKVVIMAGLATMDHPALKDSYRG
jgi:hypothetical protein